MATKEEKGLQEALIAIQKKLKAPKDLYNKFGNYKYRSAESILEAVKQRLAENGVLLTITDELVMIGTRYYVKSTATAQKGGETMCGIGYAREDDSDGISRSFSFGTSYGKILGMLESLGIPYVTCTPGKWQKEMWEAVDKAANTKLTSYNAARRLLPNMDFRRSERRKTFDDNKVDSTLLCLYAQRKQL